jgi:uncharacterized protein (TIRG00374 family)
MNLMIFRSLGIYPSFGKLLLISNLRSLISLIPITAQGIGVIELGSIYLFSLINIEKTKIVSYSIIARVLVFMYSGIFLGIYIFIFGFPKFRKERKDTIIEN